jgi:hypothetical protein
VLRAAITSGRDYIWETLRHEVQHDADHHPAGDIERYKTEYRAYSYEGNPAYDSLDNTTASINVPDPDNGATVYAFTPRQHAIFTAIKDGYAHTSDGWTNNPAVGNGTFRQAVVAYRDPDTEGANRFNSPRVDDLYKLAGLVPADGNAGNPHFQTLLSTCFSGGTALDRDDVLDVLEVGSPIRARWEQFVTGAARQTFLERCNARLDVPVTFHVRYFTQQGENVLVSGSSPQLGAWNAGNAVHLNHAGHEDWEATVPIRYARGDRSFEYKFFVRREAGVQWEGGGNRRAELSTFHATQRHDDVWQI